MSICYLKFIFNFRRFKELKMIIQVKMNEKISIFEFNCVWIWIFVHSKAFVCSRLSPILIKMNTLTFSITSNNSGWFRNSTDPEEFRGLLRSTRKIPRLSPRFVLSVFSLDSLILLKCFHRFSAQNLCMQSQLSDLDFWIHRFSFISSTPNQK